MSLTSEVALLADPWESDPEGEEDGWQNGEVRFRLSLPLPPTDNHCHRSGAFSRYATTEYRDWLEVAGKTLQEALGPLWEPDASEWWGVEISLWLSGRGDGPNYQKAVLDLLGGSRIPAKGERCPKTGERLDRSKVQKDGRGLYVNDKRVRWSLPNVRAVNCEEPRLVLVAFPVPAPTDERAEREAGERAEKERVKAAERQEREERQQAEREAKERQKAEEAERRVRQDQEIAAYLEPRLFRGKLPAAVVSSASAKFGFSENRIRAAWKARLASATQRQAGEREVGRG